MQKPTHRGMLSSSDSSGPHGNGVPHPPSSRLAATSVLSRCTSSKRPRNLGNVSCDRGAASTPADAPLASFGPIPANDETPLVPTDLNIQVSLSDFYSIALVQAAEAARSYRSTLDSRLRGVDVETSVKLDIYKTDEEAVSALRDYFIDTVAKHAGAETVTLAFMHNTMAALEALRDLARPPQDKPLPPAPAEDAITQYGNLLKAKSTASATIVPASVGAGTDGATPDANGAAPLPAGSPFELRGEGSFVVLHVRPTDSTETHGRPSDYKERTHQAAEAAANQAHFYARVMSLLDALRARTAASQAAYTPSPSPAELFAIGLAAQHIGEGWQQPRLFTPVPLPGWHEQYQSFVFVTDAGPDHIKITVQDPALLARGIVVHVEHIDRSETDDRSLMEAYRVPSHVTTAHVRLHVGDLAPTSCFIGRPTFEGMSFDAQYPHDTSGNAFGALSQRYWNVVKKAESDEFLYRATLLKAAHNTASACTAMFEAGVVDCKIAIENLTEKQAITFMRAVVANVRRDPDAQVLSAAFNINRPIYSESLGRVVGRREPGRSEQDNLNELIDLVIKIAAEGHFNKITLDGSSDLKGASIPVVDQLSHCQMLKFAHTAHEHQLITYLSAGIDSTNLHKAVNVGIDGMGIGFALHAQAQGAVGALSLQKINAVLDARDKAEQTPIGQAARTLAFLDYFSAIGALTESENTARKALFEVLNKESTDQINLDDVDASMKAVADVVEILRGTINSNPNPELAKADALLKRKGRLMAANAMKRAYPAWEGHLEQLYKQGDVSGVRTMLNTVSSVMAGDRLVSQGKLATSSSATGAAPTAAPPSAGTSRQQAAQLVQLKHTAEQLTARGGDGMVASKVLEGADLAGLSASDVLLKAPGRVFLGTGDLPAGVTEDDLIERGALVIKPAKYLPFKVGRDHLYTAQELLDTDAQIYKWYKFYHHDSYDQTMMALHDAVILNLLREQYRNHKQVGIMGGHSMRRDDPAFAEVAYLCRDLARNGFVVATGGGPGAMEAANLGAHFANMTDQELTEALSILAAAPMYDDPEGAGNRAAKTVLDRWPKHNVLSLGIPTYLYGHEPPNVFCAAQAKFFSNAVREDVLVLTCNCGIIFTPGSAGTRTEIAQFAVPQVYSQEVGSDFSKPMIFFGNFWTENTVYQTYLNLAQREQLNAPRPSLHYATKLYQTTSRPDIINIVTQFHARYYPYGDVSRGVAPVAELAPKINMALPIKLRAKEPRSDEERAKQAAAYQAVSEWVNRDHMVIGVGSGKTMEFAVDKLAQLVDGNAWKDIVCIPTSFESRHLLGKYADMLRVRDMLTEDRDPDVAIDGATAVDAYLRLVKGGGGSLLSEQVIAQSAKYYIVVADWRKDTDSWVPNTAVNDDFEGAMPGTVPVEVKPLAWKRVQTSIYKALGVTAQLKMLGSPLSGSTTPFVTENGYYILNAPLTTEHLWAAADTLRVLHGIAGVVQVGMLEHATTAAYFGRPDGTVNVRERIVTRDSAMLIDAARQQQALQQVLDAVERHKEEKPVVEIDLDLTSLMPYRRTLAALAQAGREWGIAELKGPLLQESLPVLPGYTAAAWNEWLKTPQVAAIRQHYPDLPWEGNDANKDTPRDKPGATVHSAFHLRFWDSTEEMEDDVVTPGLSEFEDAVQARGGTVVFVSGRWKKDMVRASLIALRRARFGNEPNMVVGNPGHDDPSKAVGDAEAKKLAQDYIRKTYGLPVAMFDDRKTNLDAVASLRGDKVAADFISVVACIPGYSSAPTAIDDKQLPAISNFFLKRVDPRAPGAVTAAAAAAGPATLQLPKPAPAAAAAAAARGTGRVWADFSPGRMPRAAASVAPAPAGEAEAMFESTGGRLSPASLSLRSTPVPGGLPHLEMLSTERLNDAAARHERGIVRVATFNAENLFRRFEFNRGGNSNNGNTQGFTTEDLHFQINNPVEKSLTAAAILAVDADVLALQEVESLDMLDLFNSDYLADTYKYRVLVQGNDRRGINVAVLSRYPFKATNTARFAATKDSGVNADLEYVEQEGVDGDQGGYIFSRDCLRVDVAVPGDNTLHLYVNHFKSMMGSRDKTKTKRLQQSQRVADMLARDHGTNLGSDYVIVCGDFNDFDADDSGTVPLIRNQYLENVLHRLPEEERWTHFFAGGKSYSQLDYLLLSPALTKLTKGLEPLVERRGQPGRATRYSGVRFEGIGDSRPKSSDHCPLALDIPFV